MSKALALILIALLITSCSSLQTAEYSGSRYSTPEEYLKKKPDSPNEVASITDEIRLEWPLPQPIKINRGFKPSKKRRTRHHGIDFAGIKKTPILSAHEGLVIYAGRAFKGYGKLIIVENKNGYATFYGHLNDILVKEGDSVGPGDKIGTMGRTGRATGVHLHFELRISALPVDPLPYLQKNGLDRSLANQ